jgi:hypothetical protein
LNDDSSTVLSSRQMFDHPRASERTMKHLQALGLCASLLFASSGFAASSSDVAAGVDGGKSFSQVVVHPMPAHFKLAHAEHADGHYLEQSIIEGENADNWTQMITVSGSKGLARDSWSTPKAFAAALVQLYTERCAGALRVSDRGDLTVSNHDAHAVVLGCEPVNKPGSHSESALYVIIRSDKDFYTLQWAERDAPPPSTMLLDDSKWTERLVTLTPTTLCPIVPGDTDPTAGCRAQK